jgi:cytochrome P450
MTFGIGPRSCIARDLAWIEIILVFANIIRHFRMELIDRKLTPAYKIFFKPDEKRMRVKFAIRNPVK